MSRNTPRDKPAKATLPAGLRLRARGAASNAAGRFEPAQREAVADGWDLPGDDHLLRTETRVEVPRSALAWNASPDLPFDRSINPYRGCEHGCVYCYARPSHAWLNLSPGLDFETRLIARPGIGAVLSRELRAPGYRPAPIAIGTNTDPYQPVEASHRVTREVMEVLRDFNHPVAVTTRGVLVERDADILGPMGQAGLARVGISITTLDAGLARRMEPRAPSPDRRLQMIRHLTVAGCPVRVMVAPVIPGLTDDGLEEVMEAARDAGAVAASWILLRLPGEVEGLFRDWLAAHAPGRAAKVLARLAELHRGKTYDPGFGRRMRGQGVWSDLIGRRFDLARQRLGLALSQPPLRCDLFAPAPRAGDQLALF
ncbi:PA0069 family radical SAM protein [Szabonella alba]|uniref:PA0069 family radical SAM protein n=1 Tax=Szabonella alba TaxID=2804194 RepID=A0A8K0Y2M0_9RHOB|nr:PA0069 family radical SAM protein [Szabonella alba]MBL4918199.1 PA0069 family radical SAM protein [Szabonella alba]